MKTILLGWVFLSFQLLMIINETKGQISLPDCQLTLCGRVIDEHDQSELPYATLKLKGTDQVVLSDEAGNFCFKGLCPGNYTLISSHIGCDDVVIRIKLEDHKNIFVFQEHHNSELQELVVHEHKAAEKTTLNSNEIKGMNLTQHSGKPLAEMLQSVAGVNTLKTGNNIAKPIIHGLHSNRVLIMNNGVRQEGQQWGNEHGPEIDPFISDKLTVIKGAATVRFGPDAMGGVVLVDPRPLPDSNAYCGEIHWAGFSNGKQGALSINTEGAPEKLNGFSYRLQGTLKKGGNQNTPGYYLGNTGMEEANFSINTRYDKESWGIESYYSQFNSNVGIFSAAHIGNLTDLQNAFASPEPLEKANFSYQINRPYQHLLHELTKVKTWYSFNRTNLWFTYSRQYNLREEYDKDKPLNDSLAALGLPELQFEITTHNGEFIIEHSPNRNLHFMAGINGMNQGNTYEGRFFIPNFKSLSTGGFLITQWKNPFWFLESGIRYDVKDIRVYLWENKVISQYQHNFEGFTYTAGIKRLFKNSNLHFNAGSSWRPPNVSELYSKGVHHGAASIEYGDRNLKEEQGFNVQVGFEWQTKKSWHGEVLIYNNHIRNFIYLVPQNNTALTIRGAFPTFRYEQINANLSGCDLLFFVPIISAFELKTKVSFLYAQNIDSKSKIINMPANIFENALSYRLPSTSILKNNQISINTSLVDKMRNLPENSDYVPAPEGYFLLGMGLSGNVNLKKQELRFYLSVDNLLNKKYRNYLNRFRYYADETGRNISVHLVLPFQIKKQNKQIN
jgi:iron complex outermembrane receptor protein